MNSDDLRRAMEQRAGNAPSGRERLHKAQLEASRRRRRRDMVQLSAAGGLLSVLAVFGALQLNTGDTAKDQTINLATQHESITQEPPGIASAGRPSAIVGASSAGRLVLIDSQRGNTTKVLTTLSNPTDASKGGLLGHVAVNKATQIVYFDVATADPCKAEIRSIPLAGGEVSTVISGDVPALSPDNTQLALVRTTACSSPAVVVRNLADGAERTLGRWDASATVQALSWSPNGASVLADVRSPKTDDNALAVMPAASDTQAEVTTLRPPATSKAGTVWEYGTFRPDGRVFLSERCCVSGGSASNESSRMIVVNAESASASEETLIAFGFPDKTHTSTAADPTSQHLLYLSGEDLMVSDNGLRPSPIAHGLLGAAWA